MADVFLHPTVASTGTTEAPPAEQARRATDHFNSDEPVTTCDLCIILFGAFGLAVLYGAVWAFEWIRRLQAIVHAGVTP